jgi:hypothetical protein
MNRRRRCLLSSLSLAVPLVALTTPVLSHPYGQSQPSRSVQLASSDYAYLVSSDMRSPINVRDDASTRAYARHIGYAGDRVEVLDRSVGEDGYMWYFVRFTVSNATGWVRGDFISLEGE